MTLATRCSRCRATFRLDPSTLSAAEGWVRCGRCKEVFNAAETLFHAKPLEGGTARVAAVEPGTQVPDDVAVEGTRDTAAAPQVIPGTDGSGALTAAAEGSGSTTATGPKGSDEPGYSSPPMAGPISSTTPIDAKTPIEGTTPIEAATSREAAASMEAAASIESPETEESSEFIDIAGPFASPTEGTVAKPPQAVPAATEGDDRALGAERVSLFGPDTKLGEEKGRGTRAGGDGRKRTGLWPASALPPPSKTRRARPKAAAHRRDRNVDLSEATIDVEIDALPSESAVDRLIKSNARDTSFSDYEPTSRFELPTRARHHRRPSPQVAFRIGAILLGSILALQGVLHSRHSIAARWPGVEPVLERLCAPFGCLVEAPRDLQALQVQSVSFQEAEGQGNFALAVVLLNRSGLRVKMPALDLRISDARGETVTRRVLNPTEFAPRSQAIAPGAEAAIRIRLRIDHPHVSGYEVSVFYP